VAAFWNEARPDIANAVMFTDPRLPELGFRAIAPEADLKRAVAEGGDDYEAHRIALGVPGSPDIRSDQVFALDAGFEELNGVSFRKGCYVGQEVTARMKHRSTARRRFLIVEGDSTITAGTPLEADGKEIGTVSSAHARSALALVRLDRLADAEHAGVPITAAGKPVRLRKPLWLKL
jgi:folate-binding protein YgfZ